jgi:hypothetical protein
MNRRINLLSPSCILHTVMLMGFFIFINSGLSQVSVNTIGARAGVISGVINENMVFYTELQAGGQWLTRSLGWSAYWGYWNEPAPDILTVDGANFSATGHIIGLRIVVDPPEQEGTGLLPVRVWGGFSHQIISATYVSGSDQVSGREYEGPTALNAIEAGAGAYTSLFGPLEFSVQAQYYFLLNTDRHGRPAFTAGLNYNI